MSTTVRELIVTPVGRFDFVKVAEPEYKKEDVNKEKPTYAVTMIFNKEDVDKLKPLVELEAKARKAKWGDKNFKDNKPPGYKSPIRRGYRKHEDEVDQFDLNKYPQYKDKIVVTFRSPGRPPQVKDASKGRNKVDMINLKELYSGCYGVVSCVAFAYENEGKGVSFSLQNIMKMADGEPLGIGRTNAEEDFKDIEVPSNINNAELFDSELGDL
jgi:hypothetical protein